MGNTCINWHLGAQRLEKMIGSYSCLPFVCLFFHCFLCAHFNLLLVLDLIYIVLSFNSQLLPQLLHCLFYNREKEYAQLFKV